MAWSLVQAKFFTLDSLTATISGSLDSVVTAGNLLVFFGWSGYPNGKFPNAFSANSQAATMVYSPAADTYLATGYIKNATGGSAQVQMDLTGSDSYLRLWVCEFSGNDTTAPLDGSLNAVKATYSTSTDAMTVGSITTTVDGDLVVAIAWDSDTATIPGLASSGWISALTSTEALGDAARIEYQTQSTAGSITAPFTAGSATDGHTLAIIAFKAASGAAAPTPAPLALPFPNRAVGERTGMGGLLMRSLFAPQAQTPLVLTNTYTLSPGGTLVLSGSATELRTRAQIPSGTLTFSGTASELRVKAYAPGGTLTFSGAAIELRTRAQVPGGTVVFSGTAGMSFIPAGGTGIIPQRTVVGSGV